MKVRVYFPEGKNDKNKFKEKIAIQHINMMKEYINELSLSEEEKNMIWMNIQREIKKEQSRK
ncbi:hypothetical protein [Inediibacterium massiliense]|uniref:hypothetical protein n=1 Tax=Inediibacterium massiliense TaxID=1658111 RepID=UPI0006B580C2|nr:hypothetical protein [Inediibacterium massiliense]